MSDSPQKEFSNLLHATHALMEDAVRRGSKELRQPVPEKAKAAVAPLVQTKFRSLDEIRVEIGDCRRCKLCEKRTNIVFGVGNPKADLVFVGEGPGSDEDLKGEPFVGRAGKLLDDIISSIGLTRAEVYICNVVKCRPPENRNPEPDEIQMCGPFLNAQLEVIAPKLICTLGKFAAQTLLNVETPISKLRGVFQDYRGIPLMPTYHPAYLLRNPSAKKDVWEDMKKIHSEFCSRTGRQLVRKGS